jgi:hypothetical protein
LGAISLDQQLALRRAVIMVNPDEWMMITLRRQVRGASPTWAEFVLVVSLACVSLFGFVHEAVSAESAAKERVTGTGCYQYGDNETPALAKKAARSIAQEEAIKGHRVFVQSETTVKKFQLENDVIHTASAAMLEDVREEKEVKNGQQICITIEATISPLSIDEMIRQRVNAKEISQIAQAPIVSKNPSAGVKLWLNQADGRFTEGDRLIIFLESDRDGYLKLDYFQADGTVVHMVPNKFRGQTFIKAGQKYAFGDDSSNEQFFVQSPFGSEVIKAILSTRPFDSKLNDPEETGDSREYLRTLRGHRGLVVKPAEYSLPLESTSKEVREYRKEQRPSQK